LTQGSREVKWIAKACGCSATGASTYVRQAWSAGDRISARRIGRDRQYEDRKC